MPPREVQRVSTKIQIIKVEYQSTKCSKIRLFYTFFLFSFEHEITVRMESGLLLKKGAEITLHANHYFTNFTQKIRINDKINFKGVLEPRDTINSKCQGPPQPVIKVFELNCLGCQNYEIKLVKLPTHTGKRKSNFSTFYTALISDIYISAKYILNFVFNPVVIFK